VSAFKRFVQTRLSRNQKTALHVLAQRGASKLVAAVDDVLGHRRPARSAGLNRLCELAKIVGVPPPWSTSRGHATMLREAVSRQVALTRHVDLSEVLDRDKRGEELARVEHARKLNVIYEKVAELACVAGRTPRDDVASSHVGVMNALDWLINVVRAMREKSLTREKGPRKEEE
jgi:hypothetical protein